MPWGQIIGTVVGTVAQGLLSKKGQTTTTKVNYKRIVNQARKTGFNPLTLLRNGGSANATTTTGPVLSSTDWIADAIGGSMNALANFDPNAETIKGLEQDLLKAQITNLNAQTKNVDLRSASFDNPTAGRAGPVLASVGGALGSDPLEKNPATLTNPIPRNSSGDPIGAVNPHFADAEALEARYGELGGSILGVGNMAADAYQNIPPIIDPVLNSKPWQSYEKNIAKPFMNWLRNW